MPLNSKTQRGLITSLLVLALAAVTFADTIRLKDGSRVKGKIVTFKDNRFVIEIGQGSRRKELSFAAAEVESIQFDSNGVPPQIKADPNRNAAYDRPVPAPVQKADNEVQKVDTADQIADAPAPAPQKKVFKKTDPGVPSSVALKTPAEKMRPVEWQISVKADDTSNGWTNSGWVVKKGQRIRVVGDGSVNLGRGHTSTPSGIATLNDDGKLLKNVPTGALVAVIGDDNNDFIYIGAEREFTASRDGALFLGINEGKLDDNSGTFSVKISDHAGDGE